MLDATTDYCNIYDLLSAYLDVTLSYPPKLKPSVQSAKKIDKVDAKKLSRLLELGSISVNYVPTDEIRE